MREYLSNIGVTPAAIEAVVASAADDEDVLMELMKAFEFGVIDDGRRNPVVAMVMSGLLFLAGSLPSVLPFAFMNDPDGPWSWPPSAPPSACSWSELSRRR